MCFLRFRLIKNQVTKNKIKFKQKILVFYFVIEGFLMQISEFYAAFYMWFLVFSNKLSVSSLRKKIKNGNYQVRLGDIGSLKSIIFVFFCFFWEKKSFKFIGCKALFMCFLRSRLIKNQVTKNKKLFGQKNSVFYFVIEGFLMQISEFYAAFHMWFMVFSNKLSVSSLRKKIVNGNYQVGLRDIGPLKSILFYFFYFFIF